MSGLNRKALAALKEKSSGGDSDFVDQKSFDSDGYSFRVVQPEKDTEEEGLPGFPVTKIWINNKPFISPSTFGEDCPYDEFIEFVKDHPEKDDLEQIIGTGQNKIINRKNEFWVPGYPIKIANDGEVSFSDFRFLVIGPMAWSAMCGVIESKVWSTIKSEWGIIDNKLGHAFLFTKTGVKLNTEYAVAAYPTNLPVPEEVIKKSKPKLPTELARKLMGENTYDVILKKMKDAIGIEEGDGKEPTSRASFKKNEGKASLKDYIKKNQEEEADPIKNLGDDDLPF